MEEYIDKVQPYLSDPSLASIRTQLEESNGVSMRYADVRVDKVEFESESSAKVTVSYTRTVSSTLGETTKDDSTVLQLNKLDGAWVIAY